MKEQFYKVYIDVSGLVMTRVTDRTIEEFKQYLLDERAINIEKGMSTFIQDALLAAIKNGNYELVEVEPYGRVRV